MAGNPPVKFASASFEVGERTPASLPNFHLFLIRIFLFDFFSIGILRCKRQMAVAHPVRGCLHSLLRLGVHPIADTAIALILVEPNLILFSFAIKKSLVGSEWGADHATTFWSWRHFAYFFAQDCFFVWCKRSLAFSAGAYLQFHPAVDGMSHRPGDNREPANAVLRLERGELRQ